MSGQTVYFVAKPGSGHWKPAIKHARYGRLFDTYQEALEFLRQQDRPQDRVYRARLEDAPGDAPEPPDNRRRLPPGRPLTVREQHVVLKNLNIARWHASRAARSMAATARGGSAALFRQYYEDVIDAGWVGLCLAAQRYDPARGYKFSSYAWPAVRGAVSLAWNNAQPRTVRRSRHYGQMMLFLGDLGRPSAPSLRDGGLDFDVWDCFAPELSPAEEEEEDRARHELSRELLALLGFVLEERLVELVRLRFIEGLTLMEISLKFGLSRERIRQLEVRALRRLRESEAFVRALEARVGRARRARNAADFLPHNTGVPLF